MRRIIIYMALTALLSGCSAFKKPVPDVGAVPLLADGEPSTQTRPNGEQKADSTVRPPMPLDDIPISRAEVAKMIALTMLSPDEIEQMEIKAVFSDVKETDWHFKYINAAVGLKYMFGGETGFGPEMPLTIQEAQLLLDRLNPNNKIQIKLTEETEGLPISYALWKQLYINALTELSQDKTPEQKFGLSQKELIVLATQNNADSLPPWSMVTDKGAYFFRGRSMDEYIDRSVSVYIKQDEIVFISELIDGDAIIENAYVRQGNDGYIDVFAGGAHRIYKAAYAQALPSEIADVKITDGKAEITGFASEKRNGKIVRVTDKYIELSDGKLDMQKNVSVYGLDGGEPVYKGTNGLIAGADTASFYLNGGEVCSAVIEKTPVPDKMRVLICSSDYALAVHTSLKISADSGFTVFTSGGEIRFDEGEVLELDKENNPDLFASERIRISPDNDTGRIELLTVKRGAEAPKYRGTIEISKEGEAFIVVNELDFEQYLYSVVSGQMPETLGPEAAKAQAVVARSGAYSQFYLNRFANYGANVDDSAKSQLYNAAPETDVSVRAVDETRGETLVYGGEVIRPTFFLTSPGYTANRGETWQKAGGVRFPSDTPEYLRAAMQLKTGDYGDLSKEENAALFFKAQDADGYEKGFSWFRWSVKMSKAEVEASINANIKQRYNSYPSQVLTLADGQFARRPVEGIGEFIGMDVVSRGEGGNIMELRVVGTNGEYLLKTENCIRTLIRPYQYLPDAPPVMLSRLDGTRVENYQMMPSAFYTFDIERGENNEILSINFYGGGNGHGVGMSQCGAKALADEGASYKEILLHYYAGAALEALN